MTNGDSIRSGSSHTVHAHCQSIGCGRRRAAWRHERFTDWRDSANSMQHSQRERSCSAVNQFLQSKDIRLCVQWLLACYCWIAFIARLIPFPCRIPWESQLMDSRAQRNPSKSVYKPSAAVGAWFWRHWSVERYTDALHCYRTERAEYQCIKSEAPRMYVWQTPPPARPSVRIPTFLMYLSAHRTKP